MTSAASPGRHAAGKFDSHGWDAADRVLCVRLDSIGDVLMTTPALRALRESRPGRRITLLTSPAGAAVAPLVPEIDEMLVYEAPWMKATPPRADAFVDRGFVERLRARRFDAAVIFTVYSQSPLPAAMLCYLADIPLRLAHCRENPYQLLTHRLGEIEPEQTVRHEVRRQLDLVASIGCRTADERLSLHVPKPASTRILSLLHELGLRRNEPWVVIHPGATAPSRRYPPALYAEVVRALAGEHGWQVVLTGDAAERQLAEEIGAASGSGTFNLAGRLDLAELAALFSLAPVIVTNNTGPAHVAAALGRPLVDLYALTNPQHTPWQTPSRVLFHDVPCRNCYKSVCPEGHQHCLTLVPPGAVVAAARELVQESSAWRRPALSAAPHERHTAQRRPSPPDGGTGEHDSRGSG